MFPFFAQGAAQSIEDAAVLAICLAEDTQHTARALRRYESIRIPVFMIGGWYDGYRDSIPRMLEHVKAPTKAIVGALGSMPWRSSASVAWSGAYCSASIPL